MTRRIALYLSLAVITAVSVSAWAVTGEEAVDKLKGRLYSISTMRGSINITHSSGEIYTGTFKYMPGGKFFIQFSAPAGKIIATNGKKLWVYDKGDNVCGIQDVDKTMSGGLAGYISGYLPMATPSGSSDTIIKLKSSTRNYRDVIIQVDSSYMPKKITFRQEDGKGFTVTLSNVVINEPMAPGLFDFNIPANAQVVKNPLNVR